MEERFRAKGIHISWMGVKELQEFHNYMIDYVFLWDVCCVLNVIYKPCWLNQVIFISLQTQMHSRETATAAQMNLKSTKDLFVCRIACWPYFRWCCCACLFAFFWVAIFCLLTMGIQRQSYTIFMEIGLNFMGILVGMWESIWQQWGSTNQLRHSANTSWGLIAMKSVIMQCQASINVWFCIWAIKNTTANWLLQGTCWSSFEGHPSTKHQVFVFCWDSKTFQCLNPHFIVLCLYIYIYIYLYIYIYTYI